MTENAAADQNAIATVARAVACRLADGERPALPLQVEAALRAPHGDIAPARYVDAVEVASLVVAVARFGWTVYDDLRTRQRKPSAEMLARRIRHELPSGDESSAVNEQVIDAVAEEITKDDGQE